MKRHQANLGFTIVETLFVLAIAGVIMLIVFEAIPTLQRNSRNNQRRQDAGLILGAVSHYALNNSGAIPDGATLRNKLRSSSHKLTIYSPADPTVASPTPDIDVNFTDIGTSGGASIFNSTTVDQVRVYNHAKCSSANDGTATGNGAGYNDVVALFAVEPSSGPPTPQCLQL